METKEKQIAFCQRVNDIYMKLTGDYNKDDHNPTDREINNALVSRFGLDSV